jgi:chromosome segregation ATPase
MLHPKRIVALVFGLAMLACPVFLAAQQDQESVADAARKARAEKKNAPPPKLVVDNDSLDTLKGTVNVVGGAPSSDQGKTSDDAQKAKGPAKDEAYWRGKFADANKKLADDSKELDIAQRERNLNEQQFYTNPMAGLKQEYSRQDLNDQKAKIDDLTSKVAQDKTDISNLEDELRQAGGDPGWASAPSQPAQSGGGSDQSQPATSQQPSTAPANAPAPATQSQ